MDQASVGRLWGSVRRDLTCQLRGLCGHGNLTVPELFHMVVNHYFHSEKGREFRLPLGAASVRRCNRKGRAMAGWLCMERLPGCMKTLLALMFNGREWGS